MWNNNQGKLTAPASNQAGMTTLGIMILVCFVGLFVYAGIRLVPVYMEDRKIIETLNNVTDELTGKDASKRDIYNSIYKRFDVDSVRVINAKDVEITRVEGGYDVIVDYQNVIPFIANISFSVDFEHQTTILR